MDKVAGGVYMTTEEYRKIYGDRFVICYNTSKDLYNILEILGQNKIILPKLGKYHIQITTESVGNIKSQPLFPGDYVLIQFKDINGVTKANVNVITPEEYQRRLSR